MESILYVSLGLITHIICVTAFLISIIHRCVALVIIKLLHNISLRLVKPGTETILAGETKGSPNVIYVFKCNGTPKFDKIVQKIDQLTKYETKLISGGEASAPYRPFEKLRYAVQLKYFCWCWKINHKFRAENHLKLEKVTGDFDLAIQRKCEESLDKSFVMGETWWDVTILQNTEESEEYALIWNVHHVYGDATIFTQLFRYGLADHPFPIKIEPLEWDRKHERPTLIDKFKKYLEPIYLTIFGSFRFAVVYGQCLSQNFIKENNVTEPRGKNHCRTLTLEMKTIKALQKKFPQENRPVRLVAILFAAVARALQRAIPSKPSSILASTVEACYPYRDLDINVNVVTAWFILPLDIQSIAKRIQDIDNKVREVASPLNKRYVEIATTMLGAVISPITKLLEKSGKLTMSTYISNIVGPEKAFSIFGGDLVTSFYVYSPISLEELVTFVGYTYDDKITLTMVAVDRAVRNIPSLLDVISKGVSDEISAMEAISHID